jgi:Carboxypeptidase regulatory-like domain
MKCISLRALRVSSFLLLIPLAGYAQEAVLTGTITDSTGAVLPGVTVQAVNEVTGNNYQTVADATGVYRIPVRVGSYKLNADLAGFNQGQRRLFPTSPPELRQRRSPIWSILFARSM